MPFQPELITRESVLQAVEYIKNNQIALRPATAYRVKINEKYYPPKEIVRYAYLQATGEETGILYGGEQVNRILRALEFEVDRKIKLWKLGCNWKRTAPSFFHMLQREEIVITVDKFPYRPGDIVIITEGFTVVALGKVRTELSPITGLPELNHEFESLQVPFKPWLLYAEVEWYDLSETQMFLYKLQSGIRQVQQNEVIQKVLDLWDNREIKYSEINFYVKEYHEKPDPGWHFPCMALMPRAWDDFGFQTCFELLFYTTADNRSGLGEVKILQRGKMITRLPREFTELGPEYASLGQTLAYYKDLKNAFPSEYMDIARALRDCSYFPDIRASIENEKAFSASLVRSSEAQRALYESSDQLQVGLANPEPRFSFSFEHTVPGAALPHRIDFSFNHDEAIPNSFFCLIGKNGTGKTQLLAQLAKKLSDSNEAGDFKPERPLFTKIIAVSFSLFDKFDQPSKEAISYELISFKDPRGQLNEELMGQLLWRAYNNLLKSRTRKAIWLNCIRNYLDVDFMRIDLNQLEMLGSRSDFDQRLNQALSSGQRIIFHLVTRLVAAMEKNSIVIFDEPETHLHPNIAAKLMAALRYVLRNFSSVCVLATHSPVIVQDIPSRFIRIIDRKEDIPLVRQPLIECLGENLTNINNDIFHVDEENALYKNILEDLSKRYTLPQIDQLFNNQLSFNARIYLQNLTDGANGQL
ncbi:AAA family ATPase [Mucilaginibacter sp. OK283]|jgi:ABC-type lipoprotein export system ATPase subunit|uniref:AAA family ATPase n=1 Tax=Mucilaginibacter sp. OK283 TaxID=1881049 RepID=UPI0008B4D047|nr:AAA family ATPase [Mucilaginibacter sp. OK283]SEO43261.1 ABC-type cobalamin/Fe3+-siderophores transport system, ATPase component [Mucilaginibacter sp. OK283]